MCVCLIWACHASADSVLENRTILHTSAGTDCGQVPDLCMGKHTTPWQLGCMSYLTVNSSTPSATFPENKPQLMNPDMFVSRRHRRHAEKNVSYFRAWLTFWHSVTAKAPQEVCFFWWEHIDLHNENLESPGYLIRFKSKWATREEVWSWSAAEVWLIFLFVTSCFMVCTCFCDLLCLVLTS